MAWLVAAADGADVGAGIGHRRLALEAGHGDGRGVDAPAGPRAWCRPRALRRARCAGRPSAPASRFRPPSPRTTRTASRGPTSVASARSGGSCASRSTWRRSRRRRSTHRRDRDRRLGGATRARARDVRRVPSRPTLTFPAGGRRGARVRGVAVGRHAGHIDRPEAAFVALAGDEVVGYAKLSLSNEWTGTAWHDLTGVKRAWRGRGIASALKRTQIRWAKKQGYLRLTTMNEERNAPIRRLNERYGYRPRARPHRALHRALRAGLRLSVPGAAGHTCRRCLPSGRHRGTLTRCYRLRRSARSMSRFASRSAIDAALVGLLAAACQCELDLDPAVLEVQARGHDREPFLAHLPAQRVDLAAVEEQLAVAVGTWFCRLPPGYSSIDAPTSQASPSRRSAYA